MRAKDAVDAALKLHRRDMQEVMPWNCFDGLCDHDGDCEPVEVPVCWECTRIRLDSYEEAGVEPWPCPTAKALGYDGSPNA
jgi:hypothetical protein